MSDNSSYQAKDNITPLERERLISQPLFALLSLATLTGLVTYFQPGHESWHQWSYLMHSLVGLVLALVIFPYSLRHIKRTIGLRKPLVIFLGSISLLGLLLLAATGIHIIIYGQIEAFAWLFDLHIWLGFLIIGAVFLHLIFYFVSLQNHRRKNKMGTFPTLSGSSLRKIALFNLGAITMIVFATVIYNSIPSTYIDSAMIKPYELNYGPHPFRPSQTETSFKNHFVDPRRIAGSDDCGNCHEEITQQWMASMHRQAANDQAYVSNVILLATKKGITTTRYCEGCHAPVALLTGQLTEGGEHGGIEGSLGNVEGVSCMSCHGIRKVMHLKGVASYKFFPKNDYLFADREGVIFKKIRNFLIRIHPQQHKLDLAQPLLKDPSLCATCHAQFMDKDINNWGWVKMQDEYSAWLDSPYSGQSNHAFSHKNVQRCQDCHFPLIIAKDPSADKDGKVRSHFSLGANTAIPWFTGDNVHLNRTREFLQRNKMNISIERPIRLDATQTKLLVRENIRANAETPSFFYLGEKAKIRLSVTNAQVGHDFPGGTIDINQAWLHFRVVDAQNKLVYESGEVDSDGIVDTDAHFYRATAVNRQGDVVWKHDLFNMIGERNRNVIKARATDIVDYQFDIPGWVKGPLSITTILRYRKFNMRYAIWALKQKKPNLPIIDIAKDAISLTIRDKRPVE